MPQRPTSKAALLPGSGPLSRVPAVVAFLVVAGLFAVGVLLGGVPGAIVLAVLAAGIGWLLAATWQLLAPSQRAGRVLVLLVLLGVAVSLLLR